MFKSKIYSVWIMLGLVCAAWLVVIFYVAWICFVFRNPEQVSPSLFVAWMTLSLVVLMIVPSRLYGWSLLTLLSLFMLISALATIFIVAPNWNNLLVVIPEKGGVSQARVIKDTGFLEHPFTDKIVSIRPLYAVEADVAINTDDGGKFIARSHKKEFRVIDPIAVYHRIGATDEAIEEHLRDGVKRCFHSEMSSKQFSDMLVKKTAESFSISSRPCGLGLKYYGLEPVGGNSIYFADFRIADTVPIQLQIQ